MDYHSGLGDLLAAAGHGGGQRDIAGGAFGDGAETGVLAGRGRLLPDGGEKPSAHGDWVYGGVSGGGAPGRGQQALSLVGGSAGPCDGAPESGAGGFFCGALAGLVGVFFSGGGGVFPGGAA